MLPQKYLILHARIVSGFTNRRFANGSRSRYSHLFSNRIRNVSVSRQLVTVFTDSVSGSSNPLPWQGYPLLFSSAKFHIPEPPIEPTKLGLTIYGQTVNSSSRSPKRLAHSGVCNSFFKYYCRILPSASSSDCP